MDTHTAVAYAVYENYKQETGDMTPAVIASTASPYKFTGSVMGALGDEYKEKNDFELLKEMENLLKEQMPQGIRNIENMPVVHKTICEVNKMKEVVTNFL